MPNAQTHYLTSLPSFYLVLYVDRVRCNRGSYSSMSSRTTVAKWYRQGLSISLPLTSPNLQPWETRVELIISARNYTQSSNMLWELVLKYPKETYYCNTHAHRKPTQTKIGDRDIVLLVYCTVHVLRVHRGESWRQRYFHACFVNARACLQAAGAKSHHVDSKLTLVQIPPEQDKYGERFWAMHLFAETVYWECWRPSFYPLWRSSLGSP